jgi:hypothetical protein
MKKLSKTALLSSIALAGIAFGAVAPTTVQAADGHNGVSYHDSDDKKQNVTVGNGSSAFAGSTDAVGAQADSTVTVEVKSDFLSLDAVPDFSFGKVMAGQLSNQMIGDKKEIAGATGDEKGLLKVTENRTLDQREKGFTLSAQLSKFTENGAEASSDAKFQLILNPLKFTLGSEDVTVNAATLESGDGKKQPLLKTGKAGAKAGSFEATFNTPQSAQIKAINSSTPDGATKEYKGTITWTLSANVPGTPGQQGQAGLDQ